MDLMNMLKLWIDAIHPEKYQKVIKEQKGKGNFLWDSVKIVALAALISLIIGGIVSVVASLVQGIMMPNMLAFYMTSIGGLLLIGILSFIGQIVTFIINQYLLDSLSGLFKGKGKINELAYSLALITGGYTLVAVVLAIIGVIPCLGQLVEGLGNLVLIIWLAFLHYKVVKNVYSLSTGAAAGVIIIDVVIWAIIAGIIAAVVIVLGLGAMFAGGIVPNPSNFGL